MVNHSLIKYQNPCLFLMRILRLTLSPFYFSYNHLNALENLDFFYS